MKISLITSPQTTDLTLSLYIQDQESTLPSVFKAEKGEVWWPSEHELWLGLGKKPTAITVLKSLRMLFHKRKDRWSAAITLDARNLPADWIEAAVNGIMLGGYKLNLYKTEEKPYSTFFGREGTLTVWVDEKNSEFEQAILKGKANAAVQML